MIIRYFQNLFQSGTGYPKYDQVIIQIDKSFILYKLQKFYFYLMFNNFQVRIFPVCI